ncbi:hypothetical protein [Nocardioides szechwanensis]|uniref:hypothetical protein n=1 Tax=Nocardioides szechwanensis TaxID=1005944 RepID=UPI000B815869|nr:hypothetical protein [Nocardioides szechwanensis]
MLTGCASEGNGSTFSPTLASSNAEAGSSSVVPPGSVPWSARDDFDAWHPPLPPGQDFWPTEPPSRWPDLRVRLVIPDTAYAGQTVEYAVLIRNESQQVVDLRPCGGYRQEVQVVGAGLAAEPVEGGESRFRLNCDESPRLRPDEQRSYAMRLVAPEGLSGDEILVTWGFIDNLPDFEAQQWLVLSH